MPKRSKTILTVSHDRSLQHTRTLILEEAGFTVWEATNQAEALTFMADNKEIELVVICHSVPEESRKSLTDAIKKQQPFVPVLMLSHSWESRPTYVDASVNVSEASPASWLSMVGLMTNLHSAPADRS